MFVDGRPASKKGRAYGTYEIGVDITAGKTNVLTYTVWMTELDTAHAVTIASPTTSEVVVTTPTLPGLELHIPPGTVIRDHQGNVITQITITPIPLKQPPFPLPNVPVPIYFTIQPGAAYLLDTSGNWGAKGAQLYYPNANNAAPGTRIDFWNYDPDKRGWYIYGQGTVSPDRKEVIPDPDVLIYEFSGAMVSGGFNPLKWPPVRCVVRKLLALLGIPPSSPSSCGGDGDPVDLATGLFTYSKTDLILADVLPASVTRTYRQSDSVSKAFGIGTSNLFDIFLTGNTNPYTYLELILPDGGRIRYNRISSGTSYSDAVYVHSSTTTGFYGSTISWDSTNSRWLLKFKNGTTYLFPESSNATTPQAAALIGITDRYGNTVTLSRDSNHNLILIGTQSGHWIQLTYDGSNRVTQAVDNIGRTVSYTYDSGGRLSTVTDAKSGVTTYTYDSNNNMLTITDPRNITYLTNQYDSNNRVFKQTLADNTTYQFSYTLSTNTSQTHFVTLGTGYTGGGPGVDIIGFRNCSGCQEAYTPEVSETDVTNQRGYVRKVLFGSNGYISSDTHAYGTSQQQTVTYQYFPDNLLQSSTDALNRTTAYVYDANNNTTQVTQLSGTQNAVTTNFTYESTYNQLASVTDPLSHTTSYGHDPSGNLTTITDPLIHQTTFTYNSQGQVASATDSLGNTKKFGYAQGILAEAVDPLGRAITESVDAAGRIAGGTDPTGASTKIAYDALNEVTSTTDALGNLTSFSYDGNGNLLTVTDANNHVTTYTYDNMDRVSTRKDVLNNSESYSYDAAGNLSTFTDRRGKVTSYTYDPLNRGTFAGFGTVTGTPTTYENTITYSYDAGNRLSSAVDSVVGTITPTFDNLDRLTQEQSSQGTVSYGYDATGRRTSMTVAGQTAVNYNYDTANRLTGMTQGTSTSVSFAYDNANRRSSLTLPNGIVVTYNYDTSSELTGITYTNGSTTLGNLIYSYDLAGRRTGVGGSYAQVELPAALKDLDVDY